MKSITAHARSLSPQELLQERNRLAREIPAAQSMLDAIKRELRRRKKNGAG